MSKESSFWNWFSQNEARYFVLENDLEACFDALSEELRKVHQDLTFEFGPVMDGRREFVISAGGHREAFESVSSLCAASPSLARFDITKFRPRREPMDIEYDDLQIRASDVFFHLVKDEDPEKVAVLIFLPGYSEEREEDFGQVGYLFLDEALGEYDVEIKVGFINVLGHDSKHFSGASPISGLASRFDAVLATRNRHG
jgi:hypothetical protein